MTSEVSSINVLGLGDEGDVALQQGDNMPMDSISLSVTGENGE